MVYGVDFQNARRKKTLTAKIDLRSALTSKMNSVEGANGSVGECGALAHKIVFVNVAGLRSVGLHAANGHGWSRCRRLFHAASTPSAVRAAAQPLLPDLRATHTPL